MRKIILILVAMFFMTAGASAGTLTYTDVSCINSGSTVCSSSIFVYYQDGTLAGSLNGTNDAITTNDSMGAINLYLKPNSVSLLNNPSFFFQWLINTWQMFFVLILMIGVVVGFLYLIRKIFMPSNSVVTPKPKRRWG